ncbi:MAG: hypothetical protein GKR88_09765 [Flavobacteriaceae bacterium]|nr:MAG: hypothetical protein GKR88_09765 [Flavobacteriaceae bacterium]
MVKFSKKTAFIFFFVCATFSGISLYKIDWETIGVGTWIDTFNKIDGFIVFMILTIFFMLYYVKKIKEENK